MTTRLLAPVSAVAAGVRRDVVRTSVVVLAVLLLLVGVFGLWRAHADNAAPARQNHALTDAATTAEVQSSVTRSLQQILTYDYTDPAATRTAAAQALTGKARRQYDELFAALQKRAPHQKLTLTATVQAVAVKELTDTSATLLVFLDQTSKRASDKQASASAAQLSLTLTKVDGAWRISSLEPL
ncbi:hypothetical protein AB3X52_01035 [Nocardioides sp. DS6]|uniref:Mce-associated membrane protein n=1 Tax=Nocardioides eburneus TaxID=3231482 RepID=A0ABV3SUP5_9ACTN